MSTDENNGSIALFDCDVEQRVLFNTERRGVMYPVTHVFSVEALKDASVLEFERARKQRLSDADVAETDDKDSMAVSGSAYDAALAFSKKYLASHEGYADQPTDGDRVYAVNLLFGIEFEEAPLALADQLCPNDDGGNSIYRVNCVSDGKLIKTSHELRPANTDIVSEHNELQSRTLLVKGTQFGQRDQRIPSTAKRYAEFYDLMKLNATGYAGKVPLHHRSAIAKRHLKSEQKAITGN